MNAGLRNTLITACVTALLVPAHAASTDANSPRHRLVGPSPASVATTTATSAYALHLVGGSGVPVGIAASANSSIVAGSTSNQLPTERIFHSGMGD